MSLSACSLSKTFFSPHHLLQFIPTSPCLRWGQDGFPDDIFGIQHHCDAAAVPARQALVSQLRRQFAKGCAAKGWKSQTKLHTNVHRHTAQTNQKSAKTVFQLWARAARFFSLLSIPSEEGSLFNTIMTMLGRGRLMQQHLAWLLMPASAQFRWE